MIEAEERSLARQELSERLYLMEARLSLTPRADFLRQVHSLKGVARAYGFEGVAALAHALEDEINAFANAAAITLFLDRMHDALDLPEHPHPALIEPLFATIRARLTAA